jgi:hypothetical protein
MAVRERVCPKEPYGIGLRLSNRAAQELSDRATLLEFQRWLGQQHCYVFTINGFPYGQFHGTRVKEQVYRPDWTTPQRLAYTNLLFDLLAQLLPQGIEGSVSTLPGSFKEFLHTPDEARLIRTNIWHCVEHVARVSQQTGRTLHLGLEPEPLCMLETSAETVHFFDRLRNEHKNDPRLNDFLGVNYDTCHFAVEFEEAQNALGILYQHQIKLSKIHLSNALKVRPTRDVCEALQAFTEDVYLHQTIIRRADNRCTEYMDLNEALKRETPVEDETDPTEWRIHFHIPLHSPPTELFGNTADHLLVTLDALASYPTLCPHLEMETYTWEVLPPEVKNRDVVDQLVAEYEWTLARLKERGLFGAV